MILWRLLFVLGQSALLFMIGLLTGAAIVPPSAGGGFATLGPALLGAAGGGIIGLVGSSISLIWLKNPVILRWSALVVWALAALVFIVAVYG